jgi:hypothetical protein
MTLKLTKNQIQKLALSRKHYLVNMSNYKNVKSLITIYCTTCQRIFQTTVHSYKNAKKTGCLNCKKIIISQIHKNKMVSLKTKQKISAANKKKPGSLKGRFGSKHPRWKGGVYDRLTGSSTEAYIWRQRVRQLYNFQCIFTKQTSNLECHHLESYDKFKEKRNVVSNGVLITRNIHCEFHKLYGYGNNIESQWNDFCYYKFQVSWILLKKKYNNQQPN